jgi:hypothetical protein
MGIYQAGASYVKTQRIVEFTRLKDRSANRIIGKLKAQRGFVRIWWKSEIARPAGCGKVLLDLFDSLAWQDDAGLATQDLE